MMDWLLQRDIAVPTSQKGQESLLQIAAESWDEECMEWLIRNGADVNAKDEWGRTPLFRAAECSILSNVHCLLESGTNIIIVDYDGRTVLEYLDLSTSQYEKGGESYKRMAAFLTERVADLNLAPSTEQ